MDCTERGRRGYVRLGEVIEFIEVGSGDSGSSCCAIFFVSSFEKVGAMEGGRGTLRFLNQDIVSFRWPRRGKVAAGVNGRGF